MTPTHALLSSLIHAPLLVQDLPEADSFPRHLLVLPESVPALNLAQKLGHLYEDALAFLIRSTPRFELLEQNLPVRIDAQSTLGELDFLLRDTASGRLIHLELATKFYLAVPTADGLTLPGPDARDHYFKKLHRLRSHQLRLPHNHRAQLPELYRHEAIRSHQLVYGCLFDPIDSCQPCAPEFVSQERRRGRWLRIDAIHEHFALGTRFDIIPKSLWPVPLDLLANIPLECWSPTATLERCVMIRADDDPTPYFITPSGYPDV